MTNFFLVDLQQQKLGVVNAHLEGENYVGKFTPIKFEQALRSLFSEYMDLVEHQVFSVLDELDKKIDKLQLRILNPHTNALIKITHLQITDANEISFRVSTLA